MIYQAKVENGIVTDVIVATDEVALNFEGVWISCDEATFPAIGYTYSQQEGFRPPQPFDSWIYDDTTNSWEPPVPQPDDENIYEWDEDTVDWKLVYIKV